MVWARLVGHTANYDQYAAITYQITVPPLTAVALSATPASPQPVNTPITLTATPTGGGGQVQYQFRVGYTDSGGLALDESQHRLHHHRQLYLDPGHRRQLTRWWCGRAWSGIPTVMISMPPSPIR